MRRILIFLALPLLSALLFGGNISINSAENWGVLDKIVAEARSYLGTPYVYAGTNREGVDCSGLVYIVYKTVTGASLPRVVTSLIKEGAEVADKNYRPGDLFFFDTTGGPSHVGICIGGNSFIHAASEGTRIGVTTDNLDTAYYKTRFLGARRIISDTNPLISLEIDGTAAQQVLDLVLPPNKYLFFRLQSLLLRPAAFTFVAARNNREYLSRRVWLDPQATPSSLWFIPIEGIWVVTILDETGKEVTVVHFRSGDVS